MENKHPPNFLKVLLHDVLLKYSCKPNVSMEAVLNILTTIFELSSPEDWADTEDIIWDIINDYCYEFFYFDSEELVYKSKIRPRLKSELSNFLFKRASYSLPTGPTYLNKPKIYNSVNFPQYEHKAFKYVTTVEEMDMFLGHLKKMKKEEYLYIDTETDQFCSSKSVDLVSCRAGDSTFIFRPQNSRMEEIVEQIEKHQIVVFGSYNDDTLLFPNGVFIDLQALFYETGQYSFFPSLADIVAYELGRFLPKDLTISRWSKNLYFELLQYSATDAEALQRLMDAFKQSYCQQLPRHSINKFNAKYILEQHAKDNFDEWTRETQEELDPEMDEDIFGENDYYSNPNEEISDNSFSPICLEKHFFLEAMKHVFGKTESNFYVIFC